MVNTIKTLQDVPEKSQIYIYCAGVFGRQLLAALRQDRPDVRVLGFIDSYKKGKVDGLEISSLEKLDKNCSNYDLIVIAIQPEIKAQISSMLDERGYRKYCHLDQDFRLSATDPQMADDRMTEVLYAFYDFDVSPASFAFLMFLYLAEIERVRRGCKFLQPVLVPRSGNKLSLVLASEKSGQIEKESTDSWFVQNVMTSCCWLLPSCRQLTICNSRKEASLIARELAVNSFPANYDVLNPEEHYSHFKICATVSRGPQVSLAAPAKALDYIQDWKQARKIDQKIVTITLRETFADVERNSRIEEWARFAGNLDPQEYFPVFIRDTHAALTEDIPQLSGFTFFPEAPWNLALRMALYESSYLNMFVNNGPAALCSLNAKTRYLTFVYQSESQFSCSRAYYKSAGVEVGGQFPGATVFQREVWDGGDGYENLQKEFQAMCAIIEAEHGKVALCV